MKLKYIICLIIFVLSEEAMAYESTQSDSITIDSITYAKKRPKKFTRFFQNLIDKLTETDETYITPAKYDFIAMLQNSNAFQTYKFQTSLDDKTTQSIHLSPTPTFKIGPYFGWKSLFVGYTFDVGHPNSIHKKTEFDLSLYSNMFRCDLLYYVNNGDYKLRKVTGFSNSINNSLKGSEFNGLSTYAASIGVYYVFNHKRFSYSAAYNQSGQQIKSCGTWNVGFKYSEQKIEMDYTQLPHELYKSEADFEKLSHLNQIFYHDYSLCGGYAYNWVFAPNWLFSISVTPMLGIQHTRNQDISKTIADYKDKKKFGININVVSRTGLVWNNSRWFCGASVISQWFNYKREGLLITNSYNYLNIYMGFNFRQKKR